MAYIGKNLGTGELRLFEQIEYGPYNDPRQLAPLASSRVWLNNGGIAVAPMKDFNFAPIAPTIGYLYSGEVVDTGFHVGGVQARLCKPGSRPRFYSSQKSWELTATSTSSLTRYINRFTDGEVWISTATNSRTGTQIGWRTTETTLPRGVRYVMALLIGGGGGGGGAGGSLQHSGSGGGGGACAACCVRLPENGYATLTIGGWGAGGTNYGAGSNGSYSRIASGSYWCQAGAGAGGQTSTSSTNTAVGGAVTTSGNNVDGTLFASVAGGSGPGKNNAGNAASFSITDYAPEGGTLAFGSNGGASGGSTGGGGGGASAYYGQGGAGGNGAPGSDGQGYGGGGGGGGVALLTQHAGGRGAPGHIIIRY